MRSVALAALFLTPAVGLSETYWLGRQPDPDVDEYVFDVPVSADLAAKLLCTDAKGKKFRSGVSEFKWEVGGKTHTFFQNSVSWDANRIDDGSFAHLRDNGVSIDAWAHSNPKTPGYKAVRDVLVAQKKPWGTNGWFEANPILLRVDGKDNPKLTVDFNTDSPFGVTRHPGEFDSSIGMVAPVKRPQIVAVPHKDTLYIAYQTWDRTKPTSKVVVSKVAFADVAKKKLSTVRVVPSGGTLVGFAVDEKGHDFVLTAKAETFPNNPQGDFVEKIAKTWRKDILVLHSDGKAADVGTEKFSTETVYGVGNAGSGRLAAGAGHLAATFARRHYAPSDKLIHQEANDLLMTSDLARVPHKAGNVVSHSFDQRLVFDGTDFVTLHQGDQYPITGLIIEKLKVGSGGNVRPPQFAAFSCPTSGNAVFFELGGLAAEPDGYPVLFTATRNTGEVSPATVNEKGRLPWELGMLYVRRDFDKKRPPANPFDAVGAGILAGGYAEPEKFTFDNLSWDPAASMFSKRESRTVTRQVSWLTEYTAAKTQPTRASAAKLVQLDQGKYVAIWEEQSLGARGWDYRRTVATTIAIEGTKDKKSIKSGKPVPLNGNPRLHRGDDAVAITQNGKKVAAWVTAGETNRQLALHTVSEDLKHEVVGLALP